MTNEQRAHLRKLANEDPDLKAVVDHIEWLEEERMRVRSALGIHGSEVQSTVAIRNLKEKGCVHCECPEAHR